MLNEDITVTCLYLKFEVTKNEEILEEEKGRTSDI